ncbi:MAG TPA: amino acid adenylation domain-containing protein [Longimicrobiaceae bacterium]|nr:amino acid adenylation domain-containing protein [Longimicrobiaceae bacterium]
MDPSAAARSGAELEIRGARSTEWTHYPLTVTTLPGAEMELRVAYDRGRFGTDAVRRMLGHLGGVLDRIAAGPGAPLRGLSLLSAGEREEVLARGSAAAPAPAPRETLHALFGIRAERSPEAVAVVCGEERLTYAELDRRANRLARHLRALGVGPEVRVALCLERGLEMVVSLLAVLRAGGAYVPLDPAYPPERLRFLLEDSGARVLLAREAFLPGLSPFSGATLCPERQRLSIEAHADAALPETAGPQSLAYVIYTSGSTGTPKGVEVTHANVVRLFRATEGWFGFGAEDVWTLFHSYAFDFSVWEIWGALLYGGRLVVVPREVSRDPEAFRALLVSERVTVLNQTPSAFRQLMGADEGRHDDLSLRYVVFGGEALEPGSLREWVRKHGDERPRLVNMYGITETTVHVTCRVLTVEDVQAGGSPIGRPLPDLSVRLLDPRGEPVPLGVPGELYVGGAGVARGYLNRPELTAERFVPDPFSGEAGARLYRSGDRARWLASGELEYLGRADQQVKVRGFRIEPGEIEAVLRAHAEVAEARVVVREDAPGERRLVAYVVPAGEAPSGAELRAHAGERLPEHMVPGAFVFLEALPLTVNGKLDVRALFAPELSPGAEHVAPRTALEETVAGIWREVLRVERVGVHESFFELGGHSLLATQVASRVRRSLGAELPLRVLFESPTVAGVAEWLEGARVEDGAPPMLPVPRGGPLPLSFAQERMWFLQRMDPEGVGYVIRTGARLTGPLHLRALERSVAELVRRHESLRTVFAEVDGVPVQEVGPGSAHTLRVVELAHPGPAEREAGLGRHLAEEARRPFDLAAGPPFRALLLRLGEEEHALLLAMHHIVSDGWSMGILFRELSALYDAFSRGEPSPLPELRVQYADFAAWQRAWLSGEVLEAQLAWWRERLAGAPPLLELPTDRPRPPQPSFRGGVHRFTLPAPLVGALGALARAEGTTLFMALLGALQLLLGRYARQDDVVVGTPIANRNRSETEGVIGFFTNTLALRTGLGGEPTFRELLARVRETTLGAYQHQDLPFERLVEALRVERDLSRHAVFQVLFVLNNAPAEPPRLGGVRLSALGGERSAAKFDLALAVTEAGGGLACELEYAADLFDPATAERMAEGYRVLLEAAAADPGRRVSSLPLAGPEERERVLRAWNETYVAYPTEPVHERVAAQAALTPGAAAVVFGEERLTYAELDRRAEALARRLRALGVRPESRVGVLVERSPGMVVGLLGILKAGGAFVPLDPTHPRERLAYVLEDAGIRVLLTLERLRDRVPAHGAEVLSLDGDEAWMEAEDTGRAEPAGPRNLAYVLYTSGSTGQPKAVLVEHRSFANLVGWVDTYMTGDPELVVPLLSRLTFDASLKQLFGPLVCGGAVWIFPDEVVASPAALLQGLRGCTGVVLNSVPSYWRLLLDAMASGEAPAPAGVRRVCVGGEPLTEELVRRSREAFPGLEILNGYGPTEATVGVTAARVGAPPDVHIGVPLPNARVYVVDPRMEPVPVGVPGELCAGGVQVARGYLNRPDLTAEKFVPDPFGGAGERLYRTGDLVRWRPDGNLEFLGRIDQQVKVRGFRIELGEIESALTGHPAVGEAAVLAREDTPGDQRLVAYLVPAGEDVPPAPELRAFLKEWLPDYMVPAAFVALAALPRTGVGKLDRSALPAPRPQRADPAAGYAAPRTEVEAAVAAVWQEVLGVERVGMDDNFFDLGGHSLLLTRVQSRLRERLPDEVSLVSMFTYTTVRSLAEHLTGPGDGEAASRPDAAETEDRRASRKRRRELRKTING